MPDNNKIILHAPLAGPLVPLEQVPDPVFSNATLGDGVAIDPLNDVLHAPCAGEVVQLARTGHALTLRAANGAEILLHIGVDTVQLQGRGFSPLVALGSSTVYPSRSPNSRVRRSRAWGSSSTIRTFIIALDS